jgi:Cytochrome c554 and c-prime
LKALRFTPGFVLSAPLAFESAAARYIDPEETVRCFSCHTTSSTIGGKFDEKKLTWGVTCEACHGPGQRHVVTMLMAQLQGIDDVKEKPADALDFCGACHGSFWDVVLTVPKGAQTSRFQPYWLQQSKCWGENGDARLTCTACHDPHKPLETDPESYDKACLSCHPASNVKDVAKPSSRACPVSAKNCVTCHMRGVYSPEMHHTFRDHQIRIVRQPKG